MGQNSSKQEDFFEACSFGREWKHDSCPIHVASHGKPNIVKMLVKAKCDINAKDQQGNTALHHASMAGDEECTKILIEAGCSVNAFNNQHWTPLINAAYWNKPNIIKLLISNGADITWRNKEGRNALHELCRSKSIDEGSLLKSLEYLFLEIQRLETIDRLKREAGINTDVKWSVHKDGYNPRGIDVLHAQSENNNTTASTKMKINVKSNQLFIKVEELGFIDLKSEVENVSWESEADFTPLMFACYHGHLGLAKRLIQQGANISLTDENGWSALHWAAQRCHLEIVKLLKDRGANPFLEDIHNQLPYEITNDMAIREYLSPEVDFPKIISNGYVTTDEEGFCSDSDATDSHSIEGKENNSKKSRLVGKKKMSTTSSNGGSSSRSSSSIQSTYNAIVKQLRLPTAT